MHNVNHAQRNHRLNALLQEREEALRLLGVCADGSVMRFRESTLREPFSRSETHGGGGGGAGGGGRSNTEIGDH